MTQGSPSMSMPAPVRFDNESRPLEGGGRAGIQFPEPTFQVPGPMTAVLNPYGGSSVAITGKGTFYSDLASSLHSTELPKASRLAGGSLLHGRVSRMEDRNLLHTRLLPMRAVATSNRSHTVGCPIRIVQLTRVTSGYRAEVLTEEGTRIST